VIFDDPPWLIEPKGWNRANPDRGRTVIALELKNARRRSPATGTAKMDNSKSEPTKPHAEATSALRTYAKTLRRNADKNDDEVRKLAQEIAKLSASADQMRAEAAAYDESATALENSSQTMTFKIDASAFKFTDPGAL
jgi:chromosome segregation ATPase